METESGAQGRSVAKQNWTVNQAAVLIILQDIAVVVIVCVMGYLARYLVRYLAIDIDSVFPYAHTSYVMLSITAFLTGLALFFSYVRQPLKTVGLSGESWDSLSVPGRVGVSRGPD